METIYDSPRIAISRLPGDSGSAVVSFAGVGLALDGLPHEEFVKTLSGSRHTQFFVIDKLRSWYNDTASEIVEQLTSRIGEFERVFTLGNSMGGFGAIYFGRHLPRCRAAIAFGPQYSVHPQIVPTEKRWQNWRSGIKEWTIPHALSGTGHALPLHVFYGHPGLDLDQARLFMENRPDDMALYMIEGAGHKTASFMKSRGCLTAILDLIFVQNESAANVARFLHEQKISVLCHQGRRDASHQLC